jgi:hypothetical protein
MPRKPIDYSKCLIYKLCCNNTSIKDEYYGHTTDKIRRKKEHKTTCNSQNAKNYNCCVYQFIRNNGGWDNWSMIVVEEYPCENVNQAKFRERYWIETQQATLNQVIPMRTKEEIIEYKKQYREEHKEEMLEYKNQYYEQNKEEILNKNKQYYEEHKEEMLEYHKQYYEQNKEDLLEYHKQYREEYKEKIEKRQYQKFNCECGGKYTYNNESRHLKSQKHLQYLEQQNLSQV